MPSGTDTDGPTCLQPSRLEPIFKLGPPLSGRGLGYSFNRPQRDCLVAGDAEGISNIRAMVQTFSNSNRSGEPAISSVRMGPEGSRSGPGGPSTSVITKVKPKTKRPNLYRVLILNDDYTPMEFVVHVLESFFRKTPRPPPPSCCTFIITASASAGYLPMRLPRPKLPGDGFCAQAPASPAMRDGKKVGMTSCSKWERVLLRNNPAPRASIMTCVMVVRANRMLARNKAFRRERA